MKPMKLTLLVACLFMSVTTTFSQPLFEALKNNDLPEVKVLLADNPQRWEDMGRHSFQRAQMHSLQKMREGYEAIYRQALGGG